MDDNNRQFDSLTHFAWDIILLERELQALRIEVERLKEVEKEYKEFGKESIAHSERMAQNQLTLILNKGKYHENIERQNHESN